MGNGCLKPTPRTGQIYIDCINKIYAEINQFKFNQSLQNNKNSSQSSLITQSHDMLLYQQIKQLLQKKGWLRKLIDNLTSHRQSISQAALHNFRLMTQSKGIQYKLTGLVVIDYIIGGVLRESGLQVGESNNINNLVGLIRNNTRQLTAQSQYQQSEPNAIANKQRQQQKQKQVIGYKASSLHHIMQQQQYYINNNVNNNNNNKFNSNNNDQSNYTNINNQSNSMNSNLIKNNINNINYSSLTTNQNTSNMNTLLLREIYNVKFSNIFYNMLHSLISTEDTIYVSGIKSIIVYTRYHTVKNIQQQKVTDLLQILLQHIQTNQQVNLSLKAYQMLLKKLRQSFLQNQIKHFKIFLKIWEHSYQQTNSNQQLLVYQQQYQQSNTNTHIHIENRILLQSIIHKMILSMIGSVGINKIYQQIILVYDQHKFQGMTHFQSMLINITKRDQLKKQFYRGLYSFLLSYLAVCRGKNVQNSVRSMKHLPSQQIQLINNNNNTSSLFTNKWASIHSTKTYQSFLSQYENILEYRVKRNVIQTLKRWSKQYEFVEINEIIKYNSQLVLNSFLFNIHQAFVSRGLGGNGGGGINSINNINMNNNNSNKPSMTTKLPPITNNNSTSSINNSQQLFSINNSQQLFSINNSQQLFSINNSQQLSLNLNSNNFPLYLSQQFCIQFCHHAHLQQRISIINLLYDQIKSPQLEITDDEKLLYIDMVGKLLYQEDIQCMTKHIDWCQLQLGLNNKVNIGLINLLIVIIERLTQKMLIKQLDHLAYFLYSLFDLLTKTSITHKQIIQLTNISIKLISTIQRTNGTLIILAFTQRMVKATTNDMDKNNFYYTWDFIINCVYILLTSPRNYNRQKTKSHLNQLYIQLTKNQQLKNNSINMKYTQEEIDQKIIKILLDTFGDIGDNQLQNQQQIIKLHLPKVQDFQNHHHLTGSHQKIYQLSSIAFRDMFSRGVSKAKGGFFPSHEEEVSFISQNGGFSRANSIIHQDDVRHQQKSIADVMDMIHM